MPPEGGGIFSPLSVATARVSSFADAIKESGSFRNIVDSVSQGVGSATKAASEAMFPRAAEGDEVAAAPATTETKEAMPADEAAPAATKAKKVPKKPAEPKKVLTEQERKEIKAAKKRAQKQAARAAKRAALEKAKAEGLIPATAPKKPKAKPKPAAG